MTCLAEAAGEDRLMRDDAGTVIGQFIFGSVGLSLWYVKMFCDGETSDTLRRPTSRTKGIKNADAVMLPAFSAFLFLGAIAESLSLMGAHAWMVVFFGIPALICLFIFLIGLLPISFPRFMYPEWQYAKRHGLLDEGETGKKSSQASDSGGEESLIDTQVTMRVASGWRQLSEEERGELGDLGQDESIRFIAVGKETEGYVPNIVITETEVFSGKGDKEILDDSARRLAEPHPGCRLIDDTVAPYPTARTRLVTGVYTLDDTSMTVSQLVWLTWHRDDGDEEPHRFLWAATCTCPSLACPPIIEDFMTMARTLEVES